MDHRRRPCILNCDIRGITLHRFPHPEKKPISFAEWCKILGIQETNSMHTYVNKRICGRHFLAQHITSGHHLFPSAQPSLNLQVAAASGNIERSPPKPTEHTIWPPTPSSTNCESLPSTSAVTIRQTQGKALRSILIMTESLASKNIVKHLANGSLNELCLVCLCSLHENTYESIFTVICKEELEYCVADALETVCQFQFQGDEDHNICTDCFKSATSAYKFRLQAKQSMDIITHYTEELLGNIENVEITNDDTENLLCIPLSDYGPEIQPFNINLDGIGVKTQAIHEKIEMPDLDMVKKEPVESSDVVTQEDVILVVENDKTTCFNIGSDGTLNVIKNESDPDDEMIMIINEKTERKKRDPLAYLSCSRCPIKYRFVSKLKDHMKSAHNIDVYYCKLCKLTSEDKAVYEEHLKLHIGNHQCGICNAVYKKSETLVAHMKLHEEGDAEMTQSEPVTITDGDPCPKFTCYYCGRMYKGRNSFESHIRKHEEYWKNKKGLKSDQSSKISEQAEKHDKSKRCVCQTCGKDFVDERALLWHQRLHNNDRPYSCKECGRRFVTLNRRNQHTLCAHSPPARRCPLCPALFHLRSMVNTHVKKVHLKAHKRRNRTSKHQNVLWATQTVPLQELSVDVQSDILELQTQLPEQPKKSMAPVSAMLDM